MQNNIKIEGKDIEQVNWIQYLGGIVNNKGNLEDDIQERILKTRREKTTARTNKMEETWFVKKVFKTKDRKTKKGETKENLVREVKSAIEMKKNGSWKGRSKDRKSVALKQYKNMLP